MRTCIIAPVPDLDRFATQGGAHLMLTHLIESGNDYVKFYSGRRELKILDNGLFENHVAAPTSEIISKAQLVDADVVIAPDVLFDPEGTVRNAEAFAKEIYIENGRRRGRNQKTLHVMAVPQADNSKDYLWCYSKLVQIPGVSWIGVSILACPKSFGGDLHEVGDSRIEAYRALKETGLWSEGTSHHLLGLGTNVDEAEFFAPIKSVVSNDSSSPVLHGGLGIEYVNGAVPGGKRLEKMDFSKGTDSVHYGAVLRNIAQWKQFATFEPNGAPNVGLAVKGDNYAVPNV